MSVVFTRRLVGYIGINNLVNGVSKHHASIKCYSCRLCHVIGLKYSYIPKAKEHKRKKRRSTASKAGVQSAVAGSGKPLIRDISVGLVFVCSTLVTEEFSDFMLCSITPSSSSAVRARLLVGVAYVCKPKPFKPWRACK